MSDIVSRRSVVSYALRPLVRHLGPASRLITPSANKLITSLDISRCTQPRFILNFRSEEGREEAQRWCERQGRNTRFILLEYRKDKIGQFKHEFVVVRLNSTTLCRFDRRARDGDRGHVLLDDGAPAEDSAHVLSSFETEYNELLEQSEVLLSIKLPAGEDLGVVLAMCEGIQTHSKASAYNLMRYNCYFFSWMLVAGIARRACNWGSNILSKEGWEEILQTSLAHVFSSPTTNQLGLGGELISPAISPRQIGVALWFRRIITRLRRIPKNNANEPEPISGQFDPEAFQDTLKSQYRDSYNSYERALSRLLLRSQLGPALRNALKCIETSSFSAAKCTIAEDKVRKAILQRDTLPPILYLEFLAPGRPIITPHINGYRYSQLKQAAKVATEMLSVNNQSWETAWLRAWTSTPAHDQRYEWLEKEHVCVRVQPVLSDRIKGKLREIVQMIQYRHSPSTSASSLGTSASPVSALLRIRLRRRRRTISELTLLSTKEPHVRYIREPPKKRPSSWVKIGDAATHVWETMGHKALQQWKSTWDECDKLSAYYGTIITTTMMATISERLADIAPEQLTFGDTLKHGEGSDQLEGPLSLQDFIRGRMQEHFETVDKYGFGSFQELFTTTEEVMCEIWVASLDIIESNRYQS